MKTAIEVDPIDSDPDLQVGGFITLERADGLRGVWRQRFKVIEKRPGGYRLAPVDVAPRNRG
jgi:hypothetical protein